MARKPPGTLTVSIPERYPQRLMYGCTGVTDVSEDDYGTVGLFNNAPAGQMLVVRHLTIAIQATSGDTPPVLVGMFYAQGTITESPPAPLPLIPTLGVGSGLVWGSSSYDPVQTNVPFFNCVQFPVTTGAYQWPHDWPLAYVPVGYSAIFITDRNAFSKFYVSMIWEVAPNV